MIPRRIARVRVRRPDGKVEERHINNVQPGDDVVVYNGERLPVDGVLTYRLEAQYTQTLSIFLSFIDIDGSDSSLPYLWQPRTGRDVAVLSTAPQKFVNSRRC